MVCILYVVCLSIVGSGPCWSVLFVVCSLLWFVAYCVCCAVWCLMLVVVFGFRLFVVVVCYVQLLLSSFGIVGCSLFGECCLLVLIVAVC